MMKNSGMDIVAKRTKWRMKWNAMQGDKQEDFLIASNCSISAIVRDFQESTLILNG
ncbi:hypothetical protein MYP_2979 [Sporocytophaga myxococcoides]|uniref:Uncharacterized protein n=1 Tax=Sporocytophaga myxococcoides TaxID=153721 RepID=A0A098LFL1_9BACT|nr:hypothetical protein [Sporocytophaga myxococcoides]GAL85750.1 hypothetical protein MYP_2979 [Sporocytophaga myxococcoides]